MKEIQILVKTNSKKQEIQKISVASYEIWLKSKPERGKANKELIKLLSKYFEVPQNQIQIIRGLKSKNKTIIIQE
ncbi:MAG: DUF167 domain-containing protein [Candidatus Helarchaeota archaeon]